MNSSNQYETLDPENWNDLRVLAHRMVDDAITHLETVRERPVWQPIPDEVARRFQEAAPHEPSGAETTYQEFLESILPYPMGALHTRVFGVGTWAVEPSLAHWQI